MLHRLKKSRIILTVLIVFNLFSLCTSVAAEEDFVIETKFDNNNRVVTLTIEMVSPKEGVPVTVLIINPDNSIEDINENDPASVSAAVCTLESGETNSEGICTIQYTLPQNTAVGEYTVRCGLTEILPAVSTTFYYSPPEIIKDILKEIDVEADTAVKMQQKVEKYYNNLYVKHSYNILNNAEYMINKNLVYAELVAKRNFTDSSKPGDPYKFKNAFDEIVAVAAINSVSETKMYELMTKNNEILKLDLTIYGEYSNEMKEFVNHQLYHKDFKSTEEVRQAYLVAQALVDINFGLWSDIGDVLIRHNNLFNLNLEGKYKLLSNKAAVWKGLEKEIFNNVEDISPLFNSLVEKQYSAENTKHVSSSGKQGTSFKTDSNSVIPSIPQPDVNPFKDLQNVQWAVEAISNLYTRGIVVGKTDGYFSPDENVTREQFVKMLVVAFGLEAQVEEVSFDDVDKGAWYYSFIASAYKAGLTKGKTDKLFGIGASITRQEMAVMVYRAAGISDKLQLDSGAGSPSFSDVSSISPYALESIAAMQNAGIISGMEDGSFSPDANATRAQAATIIYRLLKL